jgi:ribonuclease D
VFVYVYVYAYVCMSMSMHMYVCLCLCVLTTCLAYRSYHGITCLIQIAVCEATAGPCSSFPYASTDYIVDCLAVWGHVGPVLGPLFADPSIIKIGHALRMDIAALFRDFAIIIR